jgi:transcriptional regulator PpsR
MRLPVKAFRAPHDAIGTLDADTAATLVATAADIAIVMNRDGVIQDMSFQQTELSLELEGYGRWFGRPWSETVSNESQGKVETLLAEAERNTTSGWRQLTHETVHGRSVPILYSVMHLTGRDRIIAIGRDLRAVAALQQKLVEAQMSLERDYAKLRFAETRYRLLFEMSGEPILILDGATHRIVEANPAALRLTQEGERQAVGRSFLDLFDPSQRPKILDFLTEARNVGARSETLEAELTETQAKVALSATLLRQGGATNLLVRLGGWDAAPTPRLARPSEDARLAEFLVASPDAFALTESSGRIIVVNRAFAELAQLADPDQARGIGLDHYFGRTGVDLDIVIANLRQHGAVRLFATVLRGAAGSVTDVEVSAVALGQGKTGTFGFALRDIGRRLAGAPRPSQELPHSAAQLTELIGRVPLKDLVRETTDVIERLCIEAALELTGDNRASAAEVLGLSRQSLYVKLRRFGLADAAEEI